MVLSSCYDGFCSLSAPTICYCFGTSPKFSMEILLCEPHTSVVLHCLLIFFFVSLSEKIFSLVTSFYIGSSFVRMYSLRLFSSASTHSLMLSNLLPLYTFLSVTFQYSILDIVHHSLSSIFYACITIFVIFCIVQSIMPALYQITPTAHALILWIIYFDYSFDLTSFVTLLRYSFSSFSFSSLCLTWSSCVSSPFCSFNSSQFFIHPLFQLVSTFHFFKYHR